MFERFTEKAIKTILLAQEETRRLGHNYIGTEQILLGLVHKNNDCVARNVLSVFGVTSEKARAATEKIVLRGSGVVNVEIPFTPKAKQLLESSWEAARVRTQNIIDTEYLLAGLLRTKDSVAIQVLESLGVNLTDIETELGKHLPPIATSPVTVEDKLRRLEKDIQAWQARAEMARRQGMLGLVDDAIRYKERCEQELNDLKRKFGENET